MHYPASILVFFLSVYFTFPKSSMIAFMVSFPDAPPELPVFPDKSVLRRSDVPEDPELPEVPEPLADKRAPISSTALLSPSSRLTAAFLVLLSALR